MRVKFLLLIPAFLLAIPLFSGCAKDSQANDTVSTAATEESRAARMQQQEIQRQQRCASIAEELKGYDPYAGTSSARSAHRNEETVQTGVYGRTGRLLADQQYYKCNR